MTETEPAKPKVKSKAEEPELFKLKPLLPIPFKGFPLTEWPSARHQGTTCIRMGDFWRIATKDGDMYADVPASQAMAIYRTPVKRKP